MSDEVMGYVINAVALLAVAIVGKRQLTHIKSDVAETRKQTQNSHKTNLRDDLDDVKGAVASADRTLARIMSWMRDLTTADETMEKTLDRKTKLNERSIERNRDEFMAYVENMHRELVLKIEAMNPDDRKKP